MRPYFVFVSLVLLLCLSGCSKGTWLQGKWAFDREYTEAHLSKEPEPPKDDPLGSMKASLTTMLTPQLIAKLDGANLTITSKEITSTDKDGVGKMFSYKVIEQPTSDSVQVRYSNGDVQTYYHEEGRMAMPSSGDVHFKAYFRRVSQ